MKHQLLSHNKKNLPTTQKIIASFIQLVICLALVSCAAPPKPVPNRVTTIDGAQYFIHQVKHVGESASIIASWYLGGNDQTVFILAANPHISDAKKTLVIGTPVLLPYTKITQKEPIPEQYVQAMKPAATKVVQKKWKKPQKKVQPIKNSAPVKPAQTPATDTQVNTPPPPVAAATTPSVQPTSIPEAASTKTMVQEKSPAIPSITTQTGTGLQTDKKTPASTGTVEDDLLKELLGK